jgi:hypothetical protein
MTQELLDIDEWNADAIDTRQRELAAWIFDIWHFPGEETPEPPQEGVPDISDQQQELELETGPQQLPEVPTG